MPQKVNIVSPATDRVEEYIKQHYAPVRITKNIPSEHIGVAGTIIKMNNITLESSRTIGSYQLEPTEEFPAAIFNLMTKGEMHYRFSNSSVTAAQGSAVVYRDSKSVDLMPSDHISLVISNDMLQRRLSVLLDKAIQRTVDFPKEPIEATKIGKFCGLLSAFSETPTLEVASLMKARTSSMEDALVDAFLLSIPSNCSDDLLNPVPTIAPRQVRRALDYIHANSHTQISPEFLAELCGVSMRSLQYSFKNFVGYSISDYQIRLRTQRAKEELMANADLPVYLVAQKWGFNSASNFASHFRRLYGDTPSGMRKRQN